MMKCKVNIKWRDKKTNEIHNVGEIVEVTKARFKEVCKVNPNILVEVVDEPVPDEAEQPQPDEAEQPQPDEAEQSDEAEAAE